MSADRQYIHTPISCTVAMFGQIYMGFTTLVIFQYAEEVSTIGGRDFWNDPLHRNTSCF